MNTNHEPYKAVFDYAKWYDYLWLLIPIAGPAFMWMVCRDRKEQSREQT